MGNLDRRGILLAVFIVLFSGLSWAQADRKFIRQGNKEFAKDNFSESETYYRKAIDKNKESADAVFNAGDALYRQEKYVEAGNQFTQTSSMSDEERKKSASMYNLGNSLLKAGKIEESIEAYKNSLRLHPDNPEAKYNLAYAQDLLKEQQQQQQKNNNQNSDQDKKENKDNDQQQDQQENNNQKQQENQQQEQQQQQQQQQQNQQNQQNGQSISREDAERLLNALANDEKNVQEKVKKAKAAKAQVRTLKNW